MSSIRTYEITHSEQKPLPIKQKDTTDYLLGGSLGMKNGKIDKVLFEGGYAQASAVSNTTKDKFAFYYYNQDHLGNNREVVDAKGVVQQVTNYYPFGAPYADATAIKGAAVQPYKYNGKELDLMHGLNTYDYGARQHDPILARWDRIDPLCEKYYSTSPYAYCVNNPVKFVDPDGRKIQLCGKGAADLLQYINSISKTQYTTDANGFLTATSNTVDGKSSKYSEWLNKGIKEENNTVQVHIGTKVKNKKGEWESIDNYGGGATRCEYDKDNNIVGIDVIIGDDSAGAYSVQSGGEQIPTTMALTLMHELVGHAIPNLQLSRDPQRPEGNAIKNENDIRKQLSDKEGNPLPLRDKDDKHGEYRDN